MLASGRKFFESTKALCSFNMLSRRVNGVLSFLDEGAAKQYKALQEAAMKKLDYLRALNTIDPCLWMGRVFLFNRETPCHRDTRNPPGEWSPLHAGGDFTEGGSLFVEELKLRLRYLPGDLIYIRGREVSHLVEPWSGGQRVSVVYFTHKTLWEYFKLRLFL